MIIHIFNHQRTFKISQNSIQAIVEAVIAFENQTCDEVSVHFISEKQICELHALYFNDPSLTDCISFPIDQEQNTPYRVLGEIFVCAQVAKKYAKLHQIDPYKELTLYIVHGLLHLMGYNDIDLKERQLMREAEQRHMNHLNLLKIQLTPC